MLARPDPNTFELLPGGDGDAAVARMFCDIQTFSGEPFDGDPRYVLKRNLERAREKGFTFFVGPEMEFFYFRTGDDRSSRSTTPATSTSPRTTSARSCASRPCCASRRWASRSSTRSTRTARASTRSTCATPTRSTMADNVMTFRLIAKEVAAGPRRVRDVHAEADRRRVRLRACTRTSRCSRATSTRSTIPATSTACRRSRSTSSPACSCTRARSPRSPTSGSTRTSG